MKYLGIPISNKHLNTSAFSFLPQKLYKRLDPWKGKHLTSGGRQILSNTCLSSIPLYCMGFYWLQDGVHKKMDSIRANFLWQGTEDKFRYHMAKWEMVSRPKDQGGLGIINTRLMNDCLLVKWIWKILQEPDELWFKMLKAKYMRDTDFFSAKSKGGSQFWQGLQKVKHLFKWGANFTVGRGNNCSFWHDCWLHEVPLKIYYEDLYRMVSHPGCVVGDCWVDQDWVVQFRRALSSEEFQRWTMLYDELQLFSIDENIPDKVSWALDKTKMFTTKSLYRFLSNRGMPSRVAGIIWKCKVPLKIKFFLWQTFNNKLPVGLSLLRRGWKGDGKCCLCGVLETINHILFYCVLAKLIWAIIREVFCLGDVPHSLQELSEGWLWGKGPLSARLLMFLFAGFAWTLWVTRNKMAIEKRFPNAPSDVLFDALSLLQRWSILLKESDRCKVLQAKDGLICWMRSFDPSLVMSTDVFEL